jgi:tryptophan synthase alpha chain
VSVAAPGLDRIAAAFAAHDKLAALMPYLMAGYPDLDASADAGIAAAGAGADLIELGVPFSDPLADGPVIHTAATEALKAGATPHGALRVCERLAGRLPVVLMVYAHVVLTAATTPERVAEIGAEARGFIYTVSLTGTTGERDALPPGLEETVAGVRGASGLPVAVGFGISTAAHARAVAELADGVIVGSRVVRAAGEGGPAAVGELVSELATALR